MDTPAIGSGATVRIGSDSYGCTVVNVENFGGVVTVQLDKEAPGEGHDYYGTQVWVHAPDPNGTKRSFRWDDKREAWREVAYSKTTGRWKLVTPECYRVVFGERNTYRDPSF